MPMVRDLQVSAEARDRLKGTGHRPAGNGQKADRKRTENRFATRKLGTFSIGLYAVGDDS
jgi:hypothetical protein